MAVQRFKSLAMKLQRRRSDPATTRVGVDENPKPKEKKIGSPPPNNAIGNTLSAELKLKILSSCSDIRSLHALSRISSSWYQTYLSSRDTLLSEVLVQEVGSRGVIDALASLHAPHIDDDRNGAVRVKKFLAQYRADLSPTSAFDERRLNSQATSVAKFHLIMQRFVLDFYARATAEAPVLPNSPVDPNSADAAEPTTMELRRMYRAFYRYETFCRLFGETKAQQGTSFSDPCFSDSPWDEVGLRDRSDWFLSIFPPWEVEEMAAVFDYLIKRYENIFRDVAKPPTEYQSRHKSWEPWYRRRWAMDSRESTTNISPEATFFADYPECCACYGFRFLHEVEATEGAVPKHDLLQSNARCARFPSIKTIFHARPAATIYPGTNGRQVNEYLEIEGKFDFEGDTEKDANAAWVWAHENKNYQCYWQRCFRGFRKWGYVFWDERRLSNWGVLANEVDVVRKISNKNC